MIPLTVMNQDPHKRRNFIKKTALGAATLSPLAAACSSSPEKKGAAGSNVNFNKTYQLKLVTTWPPNFPVLGEGCTMLAGWLDQMSGGRIKVDVYGGGELVPALEAFDAVRNGVADMAHAVSYYWAGKVPAAQFFSSVPFGMNAQQMNAWLLSGGGLELWEGVYAELGLVPFVAGNTGVQMGGWFNKEINSVSDLEGLKMRIPGLGGRVISKAGGSTLLSPGGEIYTNLERGVIDATEWIGPYHDYKMGFQDVAKYYYYPGWHEPSTAFELFMNKNKFDSMPEDLQEIIRNGVGRLNIWGLSEFETQNIKSLRKIQQEGKVQITPFPKEVLTRLKELTDETLAEITAQDAESKKIYTAYQSFQQEMNDWAGYTEKLYYSQLS